MVIKLGALCGLCGGKLNARPQLASLGYNENVMEQRTHTGLSRARAAAMTALLVCVALILAFFPFLPIQLLRKREDERHPQEIARDSNS